MRFWPVRSSFFSVLLLFLSLSFSNELNAQTTTSGGLSGVVTDPSNALVPKAEVEIKDIAKGTIQSTKTDYEGVYRFFFLAPGRYTLTLTHVGFRRESRAVTVLLGPDVSVNVTLEIAKASTSVTVTEEAPLIQAQNGDFSTTMNQKQIGEVPNPGNDLTYIAQTAPGVVMNTDGGNGNFSSLGMPGTSNLFTMNGMNDNDNGEGTNLVSSLLLLLTYFAPISELLNPSQALSGRCLRSHDARKSAVPHGAGYKRRSRSRCAAQLRQGFCIQWEPPLKQLPDSERVV